jgi:nicotinamide-nucleotide adenylyltransferase
MTIALFIGRFQPFHMGHLWAIQHMLQDHDMVKIGIGSSQEFRTDSNPYTLRERERMIKAALHAEGIRKYELFAIPDVSDNEKWVAHVDTIVGHFDEIYTGHDLVKSLMEKAGRHVEELARWQGINATEIRRRIDEGEEWHEMVPIVVWGFLVE